MHYDSGANGWTGSDADLLQIVEHTINGFRYPENVIKAAIARAGRDHPPPSCLGN
jgi:hypothetical protein